jgi:hypothetical protein
MTGRLKVLVAILGVLGIAFIAAGGYMYIRTQDGAKSLQAFSAAQDVKLTYNDAGVLVDGGDTAEAATILALLENDWGYPVVASDLNPNDPVVNTPTEYMYQMATVATHTLHGTQTVVLTEDVEYKGETFKAGSYEVPVDGRYFSQFDRAHPLEGPARAQAWSPLAHGLIAELGVGAVTATTLQMGFGLAALFAALGATILIAGAGLVWATRAATETEKVPAFKPAQLPA